MTDRLTIQMPLTSWDGPRLEEIYNLVQGTPELGFTYKATLQEEVRLNTDTGESGIARLWGAYLGSELVGVAASGARTHYPHLLRHGIICTKKEYRRQRVATSLYFAEWCAAVLMGKRELEDTIITDLSPFMSHKTDSGPGFLTTLGYRWVGTLPNRTQGFKDIELWSARPWEVFDTFLARLPENLGGVEVRETERMRKMFDKNVGIYKAHDPTTVENLERLRQWVYDSISVRVVKSS